MEWRAPVQPLHLARGGKLHHELKKMHESCGVCKQPFEGGLRDIICPKCRASEEGQTFLKERKKAYMIRWRARRDAEQISLRRLAGNLAIVRVLALDLDRANDFVEVPIRPVDNRNYSSERWPDTESEIRGQQGRDSGRQAPSRAGKSGEILADAEREPCGAEQLREARERSDCATLDGPMPRNERWSCTFAGSVRACGTCSEAPYDPQSEFPRSFEVIEKRNERFENANARRAQRAH